MNVFSKTPIGELFWKPLRRHLSGAAWLGSRHATAMIISLASVPIVVANVPRDDYGKFILSLAILNWAGQFTAPYAAHGASAAIARGEDGTFLFILRERLKLVALIIIPLVGVVYYLARLGERTLSYLLLVVSGYLLVGFVFQMYRHFLVGKKEFRALAFWDLLTTSLPSVGMAVAAMVTHDIIVVAISSFVCQALVGIAGCGWVLKRWDLISAYRKGRIEREVKSYGLRFIPLSLLIVASEEGSGLITAYLLGFEQLAVFAVASKLFERLSRVTTDMARDLLRADFASGDERAVAAGVKRRSALGMIGVVWLGMVFLVLGVAYIRLFMPTGYLTASLYYAILSLAFPAKILSGVFMILPSVNLRIKEEVSAYLTTALTEIAAAVIFGYLFGVIGICVAIVLSSWAGMGVAFVLGVERRARMITPSVHEG